MGHYFLCTLVTPQIVYMTPHLKELTGTLLKDQLKYYNSTLQQLISEKVACRESYFQWLDVSLANQGRQLKT